MAEIFSTGLQGRWAVGLASERLAALGGSPLWALKSIAPWVARAVGGLGGGLHFKQKLRPVFRRDRGNNLSVTIQELNPKLRGWINYHRLVVVKGKFPELDAWIRRKLRVVLWRHWKTPRAPPPDLPPLQKWPVEPLQSRSEVLGRPDY